MRAAEEMDYPYGVALGYQEKQVQKSLVDDPGITFAYDAKRDMLLLNPRHPQFSDFEFVPSVLHELGHRYDVTVARSWNRPDFADALTQGKAYVSMNFEEFRALVKETRDNGFVQDVLEILGEGELITYAGHGILSPAVQSAEVFANLTSLRALNDPGYQLLKQKFPQLIQVFERIFEGK